MSEAPEDDQKTEAPSQKRLDEARQRGDVASAPEMRHAAMFAATIAIGGILAGAATQLTGKLAALLSKAGDAPVDVASARSAGLDLAITAAVTLAVPFAILLTAAVLGNLVAGMPVISWSRVAPKFSKISPAQGLKRMLGFAEFAKTLAKFIAVGIAAAWVLTPHIGALATAGQTDAGGLARLAGALLFRLTSTIAVIVGVIAMADALQQRLAFMKRMRMTKQELKDEHANSEGDPHIKAKQRAIRMERTRRRMMADVPKATVVIANPTHFAVALRYDHGVTAAPVVVAKGVDAVALRIRKVAEDAHVAVVENKPLARALHATCEIGKPIPPEHYAGVAEVIGFVMGLTGRATAAT